MKVKSTLAAVLTVLAATHLPAQAAHRDSVVHFTSGSLTLEGTLTMPQGTSINDSARQGREMRAAVLVRELRALKTRGRGYEAEKICRELMSLDRDIDSPLYRYGARCLASL
jgi:hypothetical protein